MDSAWFKHMAMQADILHMDPVTILRDGDFDNIAIRRAAAQLISEAREKQNQKK